jgi:hypothetical protein
MVLLGVAAAKAAQALDTMVKHQVEANQHLSYASAQMAFVTAQRAIQERLRDRERGDRLAGSAGALVAAEQGGKDARNELTIFGEHVWNGLGVVRETVMRLDPLIWGLNQDAKALNKVIEKLMEWLAGKGSDDILEFKDYVQDLQKQDAEARKRKDPRWEPPKFR